MTGLRRTPATLTSLWRTVRLNTHAAAEVDTDGLPAAMQRRPAARSPATDPWRAAPRSVVAIAFSVYLPTSELQVSDTDVVLHDASWGCTQNVAIGVWSMCVNVR